jgi:cytochrome oxidase Cu insertion factor (SCO1/SenC/PrrC family)
MKTALLAALAALIGLSAVHAADPAGITSQLPRKAAPFGVQTAPDKYTWLSEYEGKTCVIAFILTTCPHCQFTQAS